jgi:broad specificity phosphatase PhoE
MRLLVIRHGQTAWNHEGKVQGHSDIPLDTEGLRQADQLAAFFRSEVPIQRIICSDLLRACQTATPLAVRLGIEVELDSRVREQSFGDWEGRHFMDVRALMQADPEMPYAEFRPPNGESKVDLWTRVGEVADEVRNLDKTTVIVTHGGSGGILLAHLLRGTVDTAHGFRFGNTAVTEFDRRTDGSFVMIRYNDTSHLHALAEVR